ncbi:MAG: acetyl-CoA carboxylase biotin carboxyl carrier protein subunit [Phycisphaerales bacterium]|nr:acetyl-CoA carboxylase biotin carboxyl carrier protein subunit [Phycisphaerales bacterium]
MQITVNGNLPIDVVKNDQQWQMNGIEIHSDIEWQSNGQASLLLDHKSYTAQVEKIDKEQKELVLTINEHRYTIGIREDIDILLNRMGINLNVQQKAAPLKAPMPGMILKILVEPGQTVNKGDTLLILEAMKMENVLKATSSAIIRFIRVEEKSAVEKGAILIEME